MAASRPDRSDGGGIVKSSVYVHLGTAVDRMPAWPLPPKYCRREAARDTFAAATADALRLEEWGYDWVSISEHHYMSGILAPSATVLAGAIAQATSTIKVALMGPILPLNNPIRVAEEVAMLDGISDGRVICMLLRGTPNEVLSYTTNPAESRDITQEGIELILRAWTEVVPFGWAGRYFDFRNVAVWPRTLQDPHPRVYGSGNSSESIVFAARHRMGIGVSYAPFHVVRRLVGLYRQECEAAGWTPGKDDVVYRTHCHVAHDDAEAERNVPEAAESPLMNVGRIANKALEAKLKSSDVHKISMPTRPALFGSPGRVVDQLGELSDAGVGVVDMGFNWPGLTPEQRGEAMEVYASRVIPQLRAV
jgi:alkanesulfonate monooxygenase SsuD/methylene tetrahydromethanopterin reductase-like flavin-dependent oxidoreductase (luciferase family)